MNEMEYLKNLLQLRRNFLDKSGDQEAKIVVEIFNSVIKEIELIESVRRKPMPPPPPETVQEKT